MNNKCNSILLLDCIKKALSIRAGYYILVLLFCGISFLSFGANSNQEDSLYYEKFKEVRTSDLSLAKTFALRSFKIATEFDHYNNAAKACYALGYCYSHLDMIDSSLYYYRHGLNIAKKQNLKERLAFLANDIAVLFEKIDLYDSALLYYSMSKEICSEMGNTRLEAIALSNIGLIHYRLDNLTQAVQDYMTSLQLVSTLKDFEPERIDLIKANLALAYFSNRQYKEARKVYFELLARCPDCRTVAQGETYYGLGSIEFEEGNLESALEYLQQSVGIFEEQNYSVLAANTYHKIATVYFQLKDMERSKHYLEIAQKVSEEAQAKRVLVDVYQLWSAYYQLNGDLLKSIEYKDKFIKLKDSIFHTGMSNSIRNILLTSQQKEANAIISKKDKALEKSYLVSILSLVIAGLLVLLSLTFYRYYTINKLAAKRLDREVQRQTEVIKKSYQDYDHLIYRTSHDIRGPIATTLGLVSLAYRESSNPTVTDYLGKIESTAKGLDNKLAKIVLISSIQNQTPLVEPVNIKTIVEEQFKQLSYLNHYPLITTHFQYDGDLIVDSDKNILSFILGTLLENAYRYYNPSDKDKFITVISHVTEHEIEISVQDSGFGVGEEYSGRIFELFVVGHQNHGDGLGLFLARRAAERVNGSLTLVRHRKPTIFVLKIPRKVKRQTSTQQAQVS